MSRLVVLCVLYSALRLLWRYSLVTDKITAAMQIAKRVYSLAQEQNDPAIIIGGCNGFASTLYFLGDFEAARHYATTRSSALALGKCSTFRWTRFLSPLSAVWPLKPARVAFRRNPLLQADMAEAISVAKELNDMKALALALWHLQGISPALSVILLKWNAWHRT